MLTKFRGRPDSEIPALNQPITNTVTDLPQDKKTDVVLPFDCANKTVLQGVNN